jgi:hypothetical protein
MSKIKKIRFRQNGIWSEWKAFDGLKIPDSVEAIETEETMTKKEYQDFKKIYC